MFEPTAAQANFLPLLPFYNHTINDRSYAIELVGLADSEHPN